MGTFASVSLYDRGSTKPVSGRTVRVSSWPDGGPVETDPAVLTTDYYGATAEFQTVDPDVHVVRIAAAAAQPRTVVSVEKQLAAAPELPPATNDGDILTVEDGEWVAGSIPPGVDIKVGGSQPASGWWLDSGAPEPPDGTPVTPIGPTWTDNATTGGGTWTTPTQTGVTYSPASGTAVSDQTVVVTASAQAGYYLVGTTSWQHTFPVAPPTPTVTDTFDRADTSAGTLGTTTTGGKTWTDPATNWRVLSGKAAPTVSTPASPAWISDVTPTTDMEVQFTYSFAAAANNAYWAAVYACYDAASDDFYRIYFNHSTATPAITVTPYVAGVQSGTLSGGPTHFQFLLPGPLEADEEVAVSVIFKTEDSSRRVTLAVDGVEQISQVETRSSRPQGAGVGLMNQNNAVRIDDLVIYTA